MSKEQLLTFNEEALKWWDNQSLVGKLMCVAFYLGVKGLRVEDVTMGQIAIMYKKDKNEKSRI